MKQQEVINIDCHKEWSIIDGLNNMILSATKAIRSNEDNFPRTPDLHIFVSYIALLELIDKGIINSRIYTYERYEGSYRGFILTYDPLINDIFNESVIAYAMFNYTHAVILKNIDSIPMVANSIERWVIPN